MAPSAAGEQGAPQTCSHPALHATAGPHEQAQDSRSPLPGVLCSTAPVSSSSREEEEGRRHDHCLHRRRSHLHHPPAHSRHILLHHPPGNLPTHDNRPGLDIHHSTTHQESQDLLHQHPGTTSRLHTPPAKQWMSPKKNPKTCPLTKPSHQP